MRAFLRREGCETVGFQNSMWRVVIDGHLILLGVNIDDFETARANLNRQILDTFRKRLLEAFEGTYEGPLEHYFGCEIARDPVEAPLLSLNSITPKRFCNRMDVEIFHRVPHLWKPTLAFKTTVATPSSQLQTRLTPSDRCIVRSLGYLVIMTRPDLAWSYSELSKYVQLSNITHMEAAEHVQRYLCDIWNESESITYARGSRKPNELWGWVDAD